MTYRSAAETIAALDYEDRRTFQSVIYSVRLAERGAAGDRAEVLRLSRQAA